MNKLIGIFAQVDDDTEVINYQKGDEIIRNGTFINPSGWILEAGWSIGGGVASFNDINDFTGLRQTNAVNLWPIKPSTDYRLVFDVITAGNLRLLITDNGMNVAYVIEAPYANGNHVVLFTTPADIHGGGIGFFGRTTGDAGDIDNITLKEV